MPNIETLREIARNLARLLASDTLTHAERVTTLARLEKVELLLAR